MVTIKQLFIISFVFIYLFWTERSLKFSDQLVYSVFKDTRVRKKQKQVVQVNNESFSFNRFSWQFLSRLVKNVMVVICCCWGGQGGCGEEKVTIITSLLIWMWARHQEIFISSYNVKGCSLNFQSKCYYHCWLLLWVQGACQRKNIPHSLTR